ncbi:MAG: hypothetical protein DRP09_10520 [Candidatus Thorarchaeota archaeon]|nr:MAG: hypothetical protein DRP09_10520 [Candidatus Thorarchaeota archaeon]
MPETFKVRCKKGWNIDIKIQKKELKFTREFDNYWNICRDHSMIELDITSGKDCMKCRHLIAESD